MIEKLAAWQRRIIAGAPLPAGTGRAPTTARPVIGPHGYAVPPPGVETITPSSSSNGLRGRSGRIIIDEIAGCSGDDT